MKFSKFRDRGSCERVEQVAGSPAKMVQRKMDSFAITRMINIGQRDDEDYDHVSFFSLKILIFVEQQRFVEYLCPPDYFWSKRSSLSVSLNISFGSEKFDSSKRNQF